MSDDITASSTSRPNAYPVELSLSAGGRAATVLFHMDGTWDGDASLLVYLYNENVGTSEFGDFNDTCLWLAVNLLSREIGAGPVPWKERVIGRSSVIDFGGPSNE